MDDPTAGAEMRATGLEQVEGAHHRILADGHPVVGREVDQGDRLPRGLQHVDQEVHGPQCGGGGVHGRFGSGPGGQRRKTQGLDEVVACTKPGDQFVVQVSGATHKRPGAHGVDRSNARATSRDRIRGRCRAAGTRPGGG